jgi:hypothetical protein
MWFRPPWDNGEVGDVGLSGPREGALVPWIVWTRLIVVFVVLIASVIVPLVWFEGDLVLVGKVVAVLVGYVLIGTIIRPNPVMSNLGYARGFIDDPFRRSDDVNQTLLSWKILLFPGRFLGESVIDAVRLLAGEGDGPS